MRIDHDLVSIVEFLGRMFKDMMDFDTYSRTMNWFNLLSGGSIDNVRLLCCIAIDVKSYPSLVEKYAVFFRNFNPMIDDCSVIDKFINDDFEKHFMNDETIHVNEDQYCSIISYARFEKYVNSNVANNSGSTQLNLTSLERIKTDIRNKELDVSYTCEIHDFVMIIRSSLEFKNLIWVTPKTQFDEIRSQVEIEQNNFVDVLLNCLGKTPPPAIGRDYWYGRYIGLYYDSKDIKFYQPCAVNAGWLKRNGLYLSYHNEDKYGRTRPVCGDTMKQCKEKIHIHTSMQIPVRAEYLGNIELGNNTYNSVTPLECIYRFTLGENNEL